MSKPNSLERAKQLMAFKGALNESKPNQFSSEIITHKKLGPDNKCYAIVCENRKYIIKVSENPNASSREDFNYIGGIGNKSMNEHNSQNIALKNFEMKMRSLNESVKSAKIFDSMNPDVKSEVMFEDTNKMGKELQRQRRIMGLITEDFTIKPVTKINASGEAKEVAPYTVDAKPEMEKAPATKKDNEAAPFCDEVKPDPKADPSKAGKKFKVTAAQMATFKNGGKQLKEAYGQPDYDLMAGDDDDFGKGFNGAEGIVKEDEGEDNEPFVAQGSYTVSNTGGYLVQISDSGDAARVKEAFGGEDGAVSDWLSLEYFDDEDGEIDDEGYPEMVPVIDPQGYNIPLNQVMRINQFRNESVNEAYGQPDYDLMAGDDDDFGKGFDDYGGKEELEELDFSGLKKVGSYIGGAAKNAASNAASSVGNKIGQAASSISNKAQEIGSNVANKAQQVSQNISQEYNKGVQNTNADKVAKLAQQLKSQIDAMNAATVKAGGQPLNIQSVISTLSNQLRGSKGVDTSKYRAEEKMYEMDEEELTEAILNVFGQHPAYGKEPFTLPAGGEKKQYGTDKGDAQPYTKVVTDSGIEKQAPAAPTKTIDATDETIDKITEGILKSFKKKV